MALEEETEMFDLFGEEGFCSICQDDLKEGDRIRTLRQCQHLFHAACLDPWITQHGSCPMCRTKLESASELENFNTLIVALQARIHEERQRRYYTYVLWNGIRKKNPTAALFNENKAIIDKYISDDTFAQIDIPIIETQFRTRANFQREYIKLRTILYESGSEVEQGMALPLWPGLIAARSYFTRYAETHADFTNIWVPS
jgi:Ring finger domain